MKEKIRVVWIAITKARMGILIIKVIPITVTALNKVESTKAVSATPISKIKIRKYTVNVVLLCKNKINKI